MTVALRVLQGVPGAVAAHRGRQQEAAGLLVGLRDASSTLVVGALHCEPDDLATTTELAGSLLPPPLAVVGLYGPAGAPFLQLRVEPGGLAATYAPASDTDSEPGGGGGGGAGGNTGSDAGDAALAWAVKQGGSLCTCQPELVSPAECCTPDGLLSALADQYVPVRCSADLVLAVSSGQAGSSSSGAALRQAFEELQEQLCGPGSVYVAEVPARGTGGADVGAAAAAADAQQQQQERRALLPGEASFAQLGASWAQPALLRPLQRAAPAGGGGAAAPRLGWQPGQAAIRHSSLCLDVLCYVPADMPAGQAVQSIVRPAVRRQLAAMQTDVEEAAAAGAALAIPNLPPQRALHFRPPGFAHHVTVLYPLPSPSTEPEEEALIPRRKALHRLLGLPANRPLLRVASAADWSSPGGGASSASASLAAALAAGGTGGRPRLGDVHEGLPPPPVAGASVHLVQGSYDYYHYMQDKFDDAGWGCAYRSLQTICSWFARQGYAARPPPSHREVQAALVQLGDKEASFIGSKQWIGAIEIGYVLDALLGVQHRVLSVGSGDDMPGLAREIAHHFDTQGTPIMIGGGVLAYTLLGIAWEERTGRAAFLILDPHYTAAEDIKKVHAGQWVAWKQPGDKAAAGGDLFVSGSFYNLLCPQRPTTV